MSAMRTCLCKIFPTKDEATEEGMSWTRYRHSVRWGVKPVPGGFELLLNVEWDDDLLETLHGDGFRHCMCADD